MAFGHMPPTPSKGLAELWLKKVKNEHMHFILFKQDGIGQLKSFPTVKKKVAICQFLGAIWHPLGAIWAPSGHPLDALWAPLGTLGNT